MFKLATKKSNTKKDKSKRDQTQMAILKNNLDSETPGGLYEGKTTKEKKKRLSSSRNKNIAGKSTC